MAATIARLQELQEKVGNTGVDKLFRAAKKDGLKVTRELVRDYLSTDAPAQVFRKLPESKGQTGAEAQGFRLQADLIDYSRRKATWDSVSYSFVLILLDVASRRVWALPVRTKAPQHVALILYRMLRTIKQAPGMGELGVLTTDKDAAFTNQAASVLKNEGVTHRTKDPADPNIMATLDRSIMTIKKRLAQSLAGKPGPWPSRVAQVVAQYNATFHPAIRDEPGEFNDKGHAVKRFLAEQDNAEKLAGNQALLEKRKARLEAEGAYRVPVGGVSKFRRSFYQSYSSDVKEVDSIKGSVVQDKDGQKHDIKRVMAVNVFSGEAELTQPVQAPLETSEPAMVSRKRSALADLVPGVLAWLGVRDAVLSQLGAYLRAHDFKRRALEAQLTLKTPVLDFVRAFPEHFTVRQLGVIFVSARLRPAFPGARRLARVVA